MTYICDCCGFHFAEPEPHKEPREYFGYPDYEIVYGCPRCGGGYYEDNKKEIKNGNSKTRKHGFQ